MPDMALKRKRTPAKAAPSAKRYKKKASPAKRPRAAAKRGGARKKRKLAVPRATKAYVDRKIDAVIPDERYVLTCPANFINTNFGGVTQSSVTASEVPHWFLHNRHDTALNGGRPGYPGMELPRAMWHRMNAHLQLEDTRGATVQDVASRGVKVKSLYVKGRFTLDTALAIKHNITRVHCRLMCMQEKHTQYPEQLVNSGQPLYNNGGLNEQAAVMSRWLWDPSGSVRDRQATDPGVVVLPNDYFNFDQPKMCKFYPDPKALSFPINKSAVKVLAKTHKVLKVPNSSEFYIPEAARSTGSPTQGPPYNYAFTGTVQAGGYVGGKQTVEFAFKVPCPKYLKWSRLHQKTPLDPSDSLVNWDPNLTLGPDNFTPFLVPHFWTDSPSYYNATNQQYDVAAADYEKMVSCQYDIYATVEPSLTRKA